MTFSALLPRQPLTTVLRGTGSGEVREVSPFFFRLFNIVSFLTLNFKKNAVLYCTRPFREVFVPDAGGDSEASK